MSSQGIPASDELDSLLTDSSGNASSAAGTGLTTFSDDIEAHQQLHDEAKRLKNADGVVVQHRSWDTNEVFLSDGSLVISSPVRMAGPFITSSPPASPSPPRKRKFAELDLGRNTLAKPAKAQRVYYGIDIHNLLEEAQLEESLPKKTVELPTPPSEPVSTKRSSLLWTEKYRARKFTDLIGDERTHRAVMHWLKRWDQIVFPGSYRPKTKSKDSGEAMGERPFKKILMLTGPPGLGKTTLAHVCARQAGYEAQEINASDERSSSVVKGRIRDMLGTENVKGVDTGKSGIGKVRKAGKPVCVIVDEVDGVVSGSGAGGEGGFVKALIDLVALDHKNSSGLSTLQQAPARKKKGERFRMQRPLILICNDVYHTALRPLRQSSHAEVIHVRKAPVASMISRLQSIFDREKVPCEADGIRRLCEATWGVSNRKEDRANSAGGEGDMRGIMVVGEWVAGKLLAVNNETGNARLTRRWVEENILQDLAHGGGGARGLGRGGPKDIVERVFQEGAGFPKSVAPATPAQQGAASGVKGVAEGIKRSACHRLRELVETHGDTDRIVTDCFSSYPERPFQDDTLFSKPDAAYEWLHFHDRLSSAVYSSNEWELAPYLSSPILAFHHLFASPTRAQYMHSTTTIANAGDPEATNADDSEPPHPFTGPQASWNAHEATKQNDALLQTFQSTLSHDLSRTFNSTSALSTDLLPYLLRMLSPNINPVLVGSSNNSSSSSSGSGGGSTASVRKASEAALVSRAVTAMRATGVRFERTRVQADDSSTTGPFAFSTAAAQWIYRMEPAIDELGLFSTGGKGFGGSSGNVGTGGAGSGGGKTRFAVRQVLDEEWKREEKRMGEAARLARFTGRDPVTGTAGGTSSSTTADTGADAASIRAAMTTGGATANRASGGASDLRPSVVVKKDFFGRPIAVPAGETLAEQVKGKRGAAGAGGTGGEGRVWVTFHEGFSNAVRKPITLAELMRDL